MCKYELPTSRLSKVIVLQTNRQTRLKLYTTTPEKMAITMSCNLTPPDVAPFIQRYFQSYLYYACAETAISQLPLGILHNR